MWVIYALLSAIFAALVSILAKKGLEGINSNLATAIRTFVVLIAAWGIVFLTGKHKEITNLTSKNWRFLIYSGLATGASWLFYFRALQLGEASKVAPIDKLSVVFTMVLAFIFLGEQVSAKAIIGGLLIAAGTLVLVL
ncbi:EamA family transporter [Herbinix luporum]|jgi:transporter family protein|uniref:Putative membrane protein n=1 Tax=Herbinix luporum TaxID=1679721 RepID=A0A0K8J783_9FIRM|nr:EamA family transporter [Herbinix luporum]CUH93410.1 putative membrane protein [Herbinix luporum]HHT57847.1 EamA family transporter [Herbinix luporum]